MSSKDMTIQYTDGSSDRAYVHSSSSITDDEAATHIVNYARTGQQSNGALVILPQQLAMLHQQVIQQRKVITAFIDSIDDAQLQECARKILTSIHEYFTSNDIQDFVEEVIASRDAVLAHDDKNVLYTLTQNKSFIRAIAHDLSTNELKSVMNGNIKPLLKDHNGSPLWKSYITDNELANIDPSSTLLAKLQQWYQALTLLVQQAIKLESILLLDKYKGNVQKLQELMSTSVPKLTTTITGIYKESLQLLQSKSNESLAAVAKKGILDTQSIKGPINSSTLSTLRKL